MHPQLVAASYDQIADRWLDDQFSRENGVAQHARALAFLSASGAGVALNVGCGCNTRFNKPMRERGLSLEGLDLSLRMVELARASDPHLTVHHADVCEWTPTRTYRFITAWDSLWHVPLQSHRMVMLKLMSTLVPGGVFIFSAGGTDRPGEHTDSYMGPELYYSTLGIPGVLEAVQDARCVCRHLEFDQYPGPHVYVIAQKAA
jgi:predicted TPR repeat methyltransferase